MQARQSRPFGLFGFSRGGPLMHLAGFALRMFLLISFLGSGYLIACSTPGKPPGEIRPDWSEFEKKQAP